MFRNLLISFLVISSLALIAASCKSKQKAAEENSDDLVLIFGSSGGFAGAITKYKLTEDGSVYEYNQSSDSFSLKTTLDKTLAEQYFKNYITLGLDTYSIDDPGNMTYFIIAKQGERKKTIKWGGMNEEVPESIETYHRTFMKLIKKSTEASK